MSSRPRQPYAATACDLCRRRKKRCQRSDDYRAPCILCLNAGQYCSIVTAQTAIATSLSAPTTATVLPRMSATEYRYIRAYFTIFTSQRCRNFFNAYIDERQFHTEYDLVAANVRVADQCWTLCISTVLAFGARMSGDTDYADYTAHLASNAADYFVAASYNPLDFQNEWSAERRELVYRSLLLLTFYKSRMNDLSVLQYVDALHRIGQDQQVAPMIPPDISYMLALMPHFTKSFKQYLAIPPELQVSSADQPMSLSQRKYLKLKRMLRTRLTLSSDDDDELTMGTEYDFMTEITEHQVDLDQLHRRLSQINNDLVYTVATGFQQPLCFDPYEALFHLLIAEASVDSGVHLAFVYGRKASIYELIGRNSLAVHNARLTLQSLVQLNQTPTPIIPPVNITLTRAIGILVEWDECDDSVTLIKGGLNVLRELARLWIGAEKGLQTLLAHLNTSIHERQRRLAQYLHESRVVLEHEVISCYNRDLRPQLTDAADQLVRCAHSMQLLQQKQLSVI